MVDPPRFLGNWSSSSLKVGWEMRRWAFVSKSGLGAVWNLEIASFFLGMTAGGGSLFPLYPESLLLNFISKSDSRVLLSGVRGSFLMGADRNEFCRGGISRASSLTGGGGGGRRSGGGSIGGGGRSTGSWISSSACWRASRRAFRARISWAWASSLSVDSLNTFQDVDSLEVPSAAAACLGVLWGGTRGGCLGAEERLTGGGGALPPQAPSSLLKLGIGAAKQHVWNSCFKKMEGKKKSISGL